MKIQLLASCAIALSTLHASAATVGNTFTGVISANSFVPDGVAAEFPAGTKWSLRVEWDNASSPLFTNATQGQFRVTKFTLTLAGKSGPWTTSSNPGIPSFTQNTGGSHSIQFTGGWGPDNHTNRTLADAEPYGINLTLNDPTSTAISNLAKAPGALDPSKWDAATSDFKIYLNNDGNQVLRGTVDLAPVIPDVADISVGHGGKKDLKSGKATVSFKKTKVGKKSPPQQITIRNAGKKSLVIKSVAISGAAKKDFALAKPKSLTVAPGATIKLSVNFKPSKAGTRNAALTIASNDPKDGKFVLKLSGKTLPAAKSVATR